MKREFTLLALTFVWTALLAEPVGKESARETARLFLQEKGVTMQTSTPTHRVARKKAAEKNNSYYYVFNAGNDKGYVIVSGDDRTEEILGYVDHGSFREKDIPDNMRAWLQGYADQIQYMDDHNIKGTSPQQRLAARRCIRSTKHAVPVIMTTTWNQGDPYNSKCPKYYKEDGTTDQPASGCVATALAQVMNFYKYPPRIRKAIPSITNTYTLANGTKKTVTTKAIRIGTKIDWANMADNYDGDETTEQKDAVGNLMYYVGQAVGMGYGASSGAGFGNNIANAMTTYFGYDDGAYMAYRDQYSIEGWFNLIYEEIAKGYPVGFAAWSTGGGHSFVLDGFDGESLFHLNWGWGGGSDGWFLLSVLNPGDNSGIGASTSSDGYSLGQTALMNLRLPDNVKAEPTASLTINDVKIDGTSISGNYINWTGANGNFHAGIAYQKEDGTLAPVGGKYESFTLNVNTYYGKKYNVNGLLPQGTWKISPASKLSTAKVWRTLYNMRDTYIEANVDADGKTTLRMVQPNYNVSIDKIQCVTNKEAGSQQELQVKFSNQGDEFLKEVRLFASTSDVKVDADSRAIVALKKGESTTLSFFFTPSETGVYNLWLCTNSDGTGEIGKGSVEIVESGKGTKPNLRASSFIIRNNQSGTVYGSQLTGAVSIFNNESEPFVGKVVLQLWRQPQGSNTAWTSSSQTVNMEIEPAHNALANFNFTGLDNTSTYRIQVKVNNEDVAGGGLWEHGWVCKPGIVYWKEDGSLASMAGKTSFIAPSTACALRLDGVTVRRIVSNKNPNTIYAVPQGLQVPTGLTDKNLVTGDSASVINLTDGYPYYLPLTFNADTAYFHHVFPMNSNSTGWETFTLPFAADSIYIDGKSKALNDTLNHFWIYEYAWSEDDGTPIFTEATQLRGNTPYLIAADSTLAGKTISFRGTDVSFFKSESTKAVVSSEAYTFHGTTLAEKKKGIYQLNESGTAFEYQEESVATTPLGTYFTTALSEEERAASIILPTVPRSLDTAIGGIKANRLTPNNKGFYNIAGQDMGKSTNKREIKSGIYIREGRKVLIKQ